MTRRPIHPFVFTPPVVSDEPDELYDEEEDEKSYPWAMPSILVIVAAQMVAYAVAVPVSIFLAVVNRVYRL
jgi:hypothetical protein